VLSKDPQGALEGFQHLLGPRGVVAFSLHVPDDVLMASNVGLAFGDVPISLRVLALLHRQRSLPHSSSASRFIAGAKSDRELSLLGIHQTNRELIAGMGLTGCSWFVCGSAPAAPASPNLWISRRPVESATAGVRRVSGNMRTKYRADVEPVELTARQPSTGNVPCGLNRSFAKGDKQGPAPFG